VEQILSLASFDPLRGTKWGRLEACSYWFRQRIGLSGLGNVAVDDVGDPKYVAWELKKIFQGLCISVLREFKFIGPIDALQKSQSRFCLGRKKLWSCNFWDKIGSKLLWRCVFY
jgi:hypothetical protein